jgi:hypothetical protein
MWQERARSSFWLGDKGVVREVTACFWRGCGVRHGVIRARGVGCYWPTVSWMGRAFSSEKGGITLRQDTSSLVQISGAASSFMERTLR